MDGTPAIARSRHLVELRRYDEALHALVPAMGDPTTRPEACRLRAQALLGCGENRSALAAARQAVSLDPQHEWSHRLLAIAHMQLAKHKAALAAALEAMRLAPHQVETLHVLCLAQVNRHKKDDARATVTRMLHLHPHDKLTHETAGVEAASKRQWGIAENHLREALRIEPHDAGLASALADVLRRTGRREEAAETLLAAVRAEPTNHEARTSLSRVGLPALAIGGVGLVKIVLPLQAARLVSHLHPGTTAVILGVLMTLTGGYLTRRRYAGTRRLPSTIHEGLRGEHRNYALGWLGWAGILGLPLAAWAALADPSEGGSALVAVVLAIVSLLALAATHLWWTGPFPWVARWRARVSRHR